MQRDLVIAARDGDIEAYSQLVRAAFPRLYGVANLILRDADRAQDAVQDALVLAWRHVRSLRDPDAWDAWLRTAYRSRLLPGREQGEAPDGGRAARDARRRTATTRDHAAELAERDWVVSQLGSLDIDKRAVLVLHYYLDLPMPEVAEILDIPYGTAASRLHRGLEALARIHAWAGRALPRPVQEASAMSEQHRLRALRLRPARIRGRGHTTRVRHRRHHRARRGEPAAAGVARAPQGAPHAYQLPDRGRVADRTRHGHHGFDAPAGGGPGRGRRRRPATARRRRPIIVAQDGSGTYETITEAVLAAEDGDESPRPSRHLCRSRRHRQGHHGQRRRLARPDHHQRTGGRTGGRIGDDCPAAASRSPSSCSIRPRHYRTRRWRESARSYTRPGSPTISGCTSSRWAHRSSADQVRAATRSWSTRVDGDGHRQHPHRQWSGRGLDLSEPLIKANTLVGGAHSGVALAMARSSAATRSWIAIRAIYVRDDADLTIEGNTISNPGSYGIEVRNGSAAVIDNAVIGPRRQPSPSAALGETTLRGNRTRRQRHRDHLEWGRRPHRAEHHRWRPGWHRHHRLFTDRARQLRGGRRGAGPGSDAWCQPDLAGNTVCGNGGTSTSWRVPRQRTMAPASIREHATPE